MELRHLKYFLAVADTRSFTQAAERLHVVQSGVSATIKALERELGVDLFIRGQGGASLTTAGKELRPRARAIIDATHATKEAVTAPRGTVTVGALTSINFVNIGAILLKLNAQYPEVLVQLRAASDGTAGLEQQLRDGDLDIAFLVFPAAPPADLHATLIAAVPLVLVVPVGHPLVERDTVTVADLAGFSFVDCPRGYGNRTLVDNAFEAAGIERTINLEVADVGTLAVHIRNGLGIGFLSQLILDDFDETGLVTIPVTDGQLFWRFYVATSATRPLGTAARALLSLIEDSTMP